MRIKLVVAYDGTNYCGWQVQPESPTVEGVLNEQLSKLFKTEIKVIGASRTDSGVHALGNVAVFDVETSIPPEKIALALNTMLPDDVRVQSSCQVDDDFHPRHCDCLKTYEYKILNRDIQLPLARYNSAYCARPLDEAKMQQAAQYLVGEHDFKSFCCVKTQAESTVRNVHSVEVIREGEFITIRIRGNGFLYNMVRIIAGTLMNVGKGQIEPLKVKEMLEAKDRTIAGPTAVPQGLTLVQIEYL